MVSEEALKKLQEQIAAWPMTQRFVVQQLIEDYSNIRKDLLAYKNTGMTPERCAEFARADAEGRYIVLSIRPKWVEKIANSEKTIEVRKTRPKLDTPFKCYIYCTLQGCNEFFRVDLGRDVAKWNRGKWADRKGKVIGEFTCDAITRVNICGFWDDSGKQLDNRLKETCLTSKEFCDYLGEKVGYGWHISDLRIYDTPRELSEFTGLRNTRFGAAPYDIKRAPQSWCYVEAIDNG